VEHTFKAFCKFAQMLSSYLEVPAISALELRKGKHRVGMSFPFVPFLIVVIQSILETHVLFVTIRAKETIFLQNKKVTKGVITFAVESAECKTMKQMHEFLDWRSGPFATPEVTDHTMAHRPGLLRIFVLDVSGLLPIPLDGYTLPTDISNWPSDYHRKYDPKWFDNLLESIGQPRREPPVIPLERGPSSEFETFNGPLIPPARPSSPVDDRVFVLSDGD
jgi:hypothetical protein